ncbi:hypothetical protein XENTR_v10008946 [Xenopus tropicalis]|nr:golgin subfamily B member 1 isoform X2 [Xenopus tropicalis]KAE8616992.1 hypothetical protein XENTR_v10008946 [Xenopus tropicalis]
MESASQKEMSEDQMERLAHYEQLVVQLKELIQQKDAEIEQRDAQIKLERETSDSKFTKLKLQAKAKVANLNKQLEELKKTSADNKANKEGNSDDQRQDAKIHEEEKRRLQDNVSELTKQLQESQETVSNLTRQLYDSQESLNELTRQLHESQQTVEQLHERQQNQESETRDLQRKLEEQCETLNARTQFVEMLEQELQSAELQKQVLSEQFRQMETELKSLRESLDEEKKQYACQVTIIEEKLTEKDHACQMLLKELEQKSEAQQELEKMKADLRSSQDLLQQMKEELEKGQEAHKELEQMREELKRGKVAQDELEQLKEQLKKGMEDQRLNTGKDSQGNFGEELPKEQEDLCGLYEAGEGQKHGTKVSLELEQTERVHEELERMKEEIEQLRGYQIELEQVRKELEKEKGAKEELEKAKMELDSIKAAQKNQELNEWKIEETLALQHQNMESPVTTEEYHEAFCIIKSENLGQMLNEMSKTDTEEKALDDACSLLTASENVLEPQGELITQVLNLSSVEKDGLDSVSEDFAIALGNAVEDMQEKQLSILMMDIRDTKEEIESLNGQLLKKAEELPSEKLEQRVDDSECKAENDFVELTDATYSENLKCNIYEERSDISDLDIYQDKAPVRQVRNDEGSDTTCQALLTTESSNKEINVDINALNKLVSELQNQVQTLTSEKEALVKRITFLDTDIKQMEYYGAQNILAEKANSLENESKSKDVKIAALQKDLDQLNLQMSEQDALLKLKEDQLCEKETNMISLQEMLNLSQSKEERLSEALAGNERENVLLQDLLSQKSASITNFEILLTEKDQQLAELSHSLSDKVVLLNEEKHSLGLEIKILKEQLISVDREQKEDIEHSAILRKENEDVRLQLDKIIRENSQLQGKMELVQQEREELHQQLEVLRHDHVTKKEMLHCVQEELHLLQIQLQEGTREHLQSQEKLLSVQREKEELEAIVKTLRQDNAQQQEFVTLQQSSDGDLQEQIQKLTETQLHNAETIRNLQIEKSNLEHEVHSLKSRSLLDIDEPKEKEEMQEQLELQKNELDHLKKKLHASLINRKELMKKVSTLEKKLTKYNTEPDCSGSINVEAKSACQQVAEQNVVEEVLKLQLSEMESDLEKARRQIIENQEDEEKLQTLIEEMSLEMSKKDNLIKTLHMEKTENLSLIERLTAESQNLKCLVSVPSCEPDELTDTKATLENKIINLEQEKEQLQKKVQDALNSRRDTIKKAQEKDRHHREQLKQQKEEYNLLQEKYEEQQKHFLEHQGQIKNVQEVEASKLQLCQLEEPQDAGTQTDASDQQHLKFINVEVDKPVSDEDLSTKETVETLKQQLGIFEKQRDEFERRAICLEEDLARRLEEVSELQETIEHLNRELQHQQDNCQQFEAKAASLTIELDKSLQDYNILQTMESELKETQKEFFLKQEEINSLQMVLEERNEFVKNLQLSVLEKEEITVALKAQLENQAKENEERIQKFEKQVLEVQQKQDEDVEEARNKTQLQRKLQAALISRKEALKESKSLQSELDKMGKQREELSSQLRMVESSVVQLSEERDNLLDTLFSQKEELNKLRVDVDKCLADNQNLDASCESLKLALAGITHEKEILEKELESMKNAGSTQQLEWQEKLSDQQKEYESLLQSYENVSNETDRMNRALEAVRLEKQEIFHKMKSMESAKREVEKQLEDADLELENMKDKMRKFAKSKQQKILELEEENEKLRGDLQPSSSEQILKFNKENEELKAELERLHSNNCDLVAQLEVVKNENVSLIQEAECLRNQFQSIESKLEKIEKEHPNFSQDETITTQESSVVSVLPPPKSREKADSSQISVELDNNQEKTSDKVLANDLIAQLQYRINELENNTKENSFEKISDEIKVLREDKFKAEKWISNLLEEINQLQDRIHELENNTRDNGLEKMSDDIKVLQEDKFKAEKQICNLLENISQLQEEIEELKKINQEVQIAVAKAIKEKETTELEKDELEERLMNQLAELNGSIGNYQQDAMDLQIKNDCLQKELQDLQFELEEEKRKLERQKAEALSHVQKEYVDKLKSVHQGEKGRERQAKELQELLKEKQQEVRHLQKDCILFQETISGLERTVKALEFVHSECEKEKVATNERTAKAKEDTKKAKADLTSIRVLLDDTQSEAARVLAENMKLKESLRVAGEDAALKLRIKDEEAEKRLEHERDKHLKEIKNMQEKLDLLQQDKEKMQETITGLQTALDNKTMELKELQGSLNQNIAKLAAFTRSMCSLQDDRDRVIEESKKWNKKFSGAMQAKDNEMEEKEKICTSLKNKLTEITSQAEELREQVIRLEKVNKELTTAIHTDAESHLKVQNSLLEEKAVLSSQLEEEQRLQHSSQEELKLRNLEATDRQNQLDALETEIKQFKAEKENQLDTIKRLELKVQDMGLHIEQIESDLQASKTLTEQLHRELEQKEQDVVRLLSSQDEAVSTAVRELQELHAAESKELQERIADMEQERSQLREKLEAIKAQAQHSQEDTRRSKTQLEAITKSMCSLQEERERLISDYQQLEERHLSAILAKDSLIQEAAAEGNELREELRSLLSRTDDLNAQNAKLNAQLARYREDLKELITLKDSQLKQLLGEKLQEIERLRQEQSAQEQQLKQEKEQGDILQQQLEETRKEKQSTQLEVETLTLCVSKLQTEREEGETRYAEEIEEVQKLKEELLQLQSELTLVKEEKYQIQTEAEKRLKSVEEELQRKLQSLQHDTGIMRNETETAEERVAELARDLMDAEQHLLHANEENSSLTARIQAFEGSMRSLQDSHDSAKEELHKMHLEQRKWSFMEETHREEQQTLKALLEEQAAKLEAGQMQISQLSSDLQASQNHIKFLENLQEESKRLQGALNSSQREVAIHVQNTDLKDRKVPSNTSDSLLSALQTSQEEVQSLQKQLNDALSQVHHKELRVQQLNGKLSQIFEEKNALSMQLRGSSQNLKDALSRYASLEKQLQELAPKNQVSVQEAVMVDSAPGAPQERKEIHTEADQQLIELQQRYQEMKHKNTEAEQVVAVLERQLLDERQRAEDRFQEMEENMQRLQVNNWSTPEDPNMSQELSLLIEPPEIVKTKARSSSIRRFLRHGLFSRRRTPLLIALYQVVIHALLLLCITGHL